MGLGVKHGFNRVERIADGYVLICGCGWQSQRDASAGAVGLAWDDHLRDSLTSVESG